MSAQSLTDEVKKRSAWSIFMGVVTAALGVFLIVYPLGDRDDHNPLARLGIDFRRRRSIRLRASLSDGREFLPESSFRCALWNHWSCLGVLSLRRRGSADGTSWNITAGSGGTGDCDGVPGEATRRLGMVSVRCCRELHAWAY